MELLLISIGSFVLMFMLSVFMRSGRFLGSLLFSAASGLAGLFVTYGIGLYTTPLLVISPLTLGVSTLLGLPGVIGMLLVKLL